MLQVNQLDNDLKKALAVAFCVNTVTNTTSGNGINVIVSKVDNIHNIVDDVDENNKFIVDVEDYKGIQLDLHP